jgi:hypothetical protein
MDGIINFFALRPTFTLFGIKVVWYLYLLNAVVQVYVSISGVSQILAQRGLRLDLWSPSLLPAFLALAAQIAVVRLLLEVAAHIISSSQTSTREAWIDATTVPGGCLVAFCGNRPVIPQSTDGAARDPGRAEFWAQFRAFVDLSRHWRGLCPWLSEACSAFAIGDARVCRGG